MLERIGQAYRFAATGIAIGSFSLGGGLLAITVFPILGLFVRAEDDLERKIQDVIRHTFSVYLRCITWLRIIDLEIVDAERLMKCSRCVVVANHPTLLDVVLLLSLVPRGACIAKHQLWSNIFLRNVVANAGYVPNDLPTDQLLEKCIKIFEANGNLLIFPEGTRAETGQELNFMRGFANIAILAKADIQLVFIHCDQPFLTKSRPWYVVPRDRPRFRVAAIDRLPVESFTKSPHRSLNARHVVRTLETLYRDRLANA